MSDTSLVFNLVARDRASATLDKFKEHVSTAATGIATGVAAALGVGIAANLDMESASDKLAAQLGIGPAKAAELSKVSAHIYANAWGESTAEVNDAIKGVYQQIGDTSKAQGGLEGVTTKVMALSETFDQDLGGVTKAVGQMLKTGLAKNADEALDTLTRGFQLGADKAEDLLDTMNEYGVQFKKFGIDGQMATGLLSQGLKAGARDADLVADAIKEFSIRSIDGSQGAADAYKALGLNASDMMAKIGKGGKSATDALALTLDKLRGIEDPVKREAAAVGLFGTQAEDLGSALYALDPTTAVAALGKVGGAADKMSKQVGDNPAAALESFKRKAIVKLSEIAGHFVTFGMENQKVVGPLLIGLAGLAAVVLTIKAGMMAWAAAQAVWSAATAIATGVQWLWNTAMFAWPGTWIIAAILLVIAAIVILWNRSETFRKIVMGAWNGIKAAALAVGGWFKNTLWPWMRGVYDSISKKAGSMWTTVRGYWNALVKFVTGIPGRISKAASGMWDGIKDSFRSAINWVISKWNNFSFTIGGGSVLGVDIPSVTLGTPDIPYLATGGTITRSGSAIVGEAGPELLSMPRGASVTPLRRGGMGGVVHVVVDVRGGDADMVRMVRKWVRVKGHGSVQATFGNG